MSNIRFITFDITNGRVSFSYETGEESGNIYFELSPPIQPKNDLIALALSTLCGSKYSHIHYDIDVSHSVVKDISAFTNATVTALKSTDDLSQTKKKNNVTLNFSGGFDSLAAMCLMPTDTSLVSMDFGGRFSRERVFFENFDTCIVSTNLLESSLRYNSWSFMGIASILFKDYLNTNYHTFGSILEAGANNFSDNPSAAKNAGFPPFLAAGIENAPYVLGLTEIGTLRVLGHFRPELIGPSLDSLANPGEEKRYRKQVLASIEEERTGKDFKLNIIDPPPRKHFKFGQSFAVDFLSFYTIKYAGLEVASYTLSEIPREVVELANRLSLEFYERVNPNFLANFPRELLSGLLSKLAEANVIPYTQKDWEEFNKVRILLSNYHHAINSEEKDEVESKKNEEEIYRMSRLFESGVLSEEEYSEIEMEFSKK